MMKVQAVKDVMVDYPKEGERIISGDYTFRIGASPNMTVDVAIDGAEWRPCRQVGGYWWFDWSGYTSGKHQAIVRARPEAGQKAVMEKRRFLVELP